MNIKEFIDKYELTYEVERVRYRPDGLFINLEFHYKFTISGTEESYSGYYSDGSAIPEPPDLVDVLESLSYDIASVVNCVDWAEFLIEYGFMNSAQSIRSGYSAWTGCWMAYNGLERVISRDGLQEFLDIDWDYTYSLVEESDENVE